MAVENVVIKISATANTREIRKARRELERMAAAGKLGSTTQADLTKYLDKADRRLQFYKNTMAKTAKIMVSLNKVAVKLFTIGFALGSAALAANNALFAAGRALVDAYKWAMQGAAVAVAALGAAASVAAAAFKEYNAAVNAYAFKSSPTLNRRIAEASAALRGIEEDSTLATFGVQSLSQAFAAIAKSSQVTGTSKTLLKGLADFAAAGGDPAKNLAAAGEFVGLLQKSGKLDAQAIQAAQGIGPAFVEALKKARNQGVQTLDQFKAMLSSGELAKIGGVEGQAALVGQTVFGQFKALVVRAKNLGSDLGQGLLGPLKAFIDETFAVFERLMSRIGPSMMQFGQQRMFGPLISALKILENLTVKLFTDYLPASVGMLGRFKAVWDQIVFVVRDIIDRLRGLLPIGSAVIEAFGKPFVAIFTTTSYWIKYLGEKIRGNQQRYNDFGQALLKLIEKIRDVGAKFIDIFTDALPALNQILSWATSLLGTMMSIASVIGVIGNGLGGIVSGLGGPGAGMGGLAQMIGIGLAGFALSKRIKRLKNVPGYQEDITPGTIVVDKAKKYTLAGRMGGAIKRRFGGAASRVGAFKGRYGQARAGVTASGAEQLKIRGAAQNQFGQYFGEGNDRTFYPEGTQISPSKGRLASLIDAALPAASAVPGGKVATTALRLKAAIARSNRRMARRLSGFGVGAGLGIGSMFASEEAQPSMQMGAMIASMAPMLGAAGPAAALAGLGISGFGMAKTARTGKGGALGGAMAGAAVGAAIGTFVPVIGTAMGAVIGAVGGAIVGAFKGRIRGEKMKAQEAAQSFAYSQISAVAGAFVRADLGGARQAMLAGRTRIAELKDIAKMYSTDRDLRKSRAAQELATGIINEDEAKGLAAAPGTYIKELEKQQADVEKSMNAMMNKFTTASTVASKALGMTGEELQQLALEKGVNLYDQTVSLQDQFMKLGLAMNYTSEQIEQTIRDITVGAMDSFRAAIRGQNAPQVIDEITEALYSDFTSGGKIDQQRLSNYVTDLFDQLNLMYPNDPLLAFEKLTELVGTDGSLFRPGQQLEGMGSVFAGVSGKVAGAGETVLANARTSLADMISKQALFGGVAIDKETLTTQLGQLDTAGLRRVQTLLQQGALDPSTFASIVNPSSSRAGSIAGRQSVEGVLAQMGLGGVGFNALPQGTMTPEQMIEAYGEAGYGMIQGVSQAIESSFEKSPEWYKRNPTWMNKETFIAALDPDGNGKLDDTRTPRGDTTSSRLGRTLSRHNYFDSMMTGKRSMTSSYRATNLGSINSDHVTGKAYDLTGQNLGAYATMVNRAGGFAEFHGRGGGRHLHVVPGETPVGDSTAPYMGQVAAPGGSSATTNNYSIVVNGGPGMDVSALADEVMNRIQRIERSSRERV